MIICMLSKQNQNLSMLRNSAYGGKSWNAWQYLKFLQSETVEGNNLKGVNKTRKYVVVMVTFQLEIYNFHLPKPRSPTEQIPKQVISTVVSPDSRSWAREGVRGGTPGTTAAAVSFDIQAWLIYGVREIVPLLFSLHEEKVLAVPLPTYSIMKLGSEHVALTSEHVALTYSLPIIVWCMEC